MSTRIAIVADATDPATVTPLLDHVVAKVGSPDVLINTIGAHISAISAR